MFPNRQIQVAVILAAVALIFLVVHGQKRYTLDLTLVDVNGRQLIFQNYCVGLKSVASINTAINCGVSNGSITLGSVPRGIYWLRVWFGDISKVDHTLYLEEVNISRSHKKYVQLTNVRQDVSVVYDEVRTTIPQTHSGEDIVLRPYSEN